MAIGYVRVSEVCKVVEVLTHCTLEINLDLNEFIVVNHGSIHELTAKQASSPGFINCI